MRRATSLLLSFLLLSLSGCLTTQADAISYLEGALPDQDASGRILILGAAAAAGYDVETWPTMDHPVVEGLAVPGDYGDALRLLHARAVADAPGLHWADLRDAAWEGHDGSQFGSNASIIDDALALTALVAAGEDPHDDRLWATVQMLRAAQADDGGWRFDGGSPGEPDETAFILRALDEAGALDAGNQLAARAFLEDRMAADGSYGYGGTANCQSTGLALMAWSHVDAEPPTVVQDYVLSCQNRDGGFPYIKGGPSQVWATTEIVQGLAAAS